MIKELTKEILDYCYKEYKVVAQYDKASKYDFLSEGICEVLTYYSDLSDLFGRKIAEVMRAILDGNTYSYLLGGDENRITYTIVCNLLDKLEWIEWGISMNVPWINEFPGVVLGTLCSTDIRMDSPYYDSDGVKLTKENVRVLLDWLEEEE